MVKRNSRRLCSSLALLLSVCAVSLATPTRSAARSVVTLSVGALATGGDGTLWASLIYDIVAQVGAPYASIERIAPDGAVRVYPLAGDIAPAGLSADPAGNLWFAAYRINGNHGRIGRLTPRGGLAEFPLPDPGADEQEVPSAIAARPDGGAWFTVDLYPTHQSTIGLVTAHGAIAEFPAGGRAHSIAATGSGAVWFDSIGGSFYSGPDRVSLGYRTPAGPERFYRLADLDGDGDGAIGGMAAARDGSVWFTEPGRGRIGHMTLAGVVREYAVPGTAGGVLSAIAAGRDGTLWFTAGRAVGRIDGSGTVRLLALAPGLRADANPLCLAVGLDARPWFTIQQAPPALYRQAAWIARLTRAGRVAYTPVAAGLVVPTLYAATWAAYDRWSRGQPPIVAYPPVALPAREAYWTSGAPAPPSATDRFPAGTRTIAYYFAFSGARSAEGYSDAATFEAAISDAAGAVVARGATHTFAHPTGAFMTYFSLSPPLPAGLYRLDLIVAGRSVAASAFTIGG